MNKIKMLIDKYLLLTVALCSVAMQVSYANEQLRKETDKSSISTSIATELIEANKEPTFKVVALAPHIVEMLFSIGAGRNIVGTVEHADYPEAAKNIPRIGGFYGIQIEKLLALKPDLVIVWQTGNKADDIEKMQNLGLNVVFSNPKNIDDVATELRYFGQLTQRQSAAEIAAKNYEKKLSFIRKINKKKPTITAFYQLWPEPLMTINGTTWINQLLDICQVSNVFADNSTQFPQISLENVIVAKPSLIIVPKERSVKVQPQIAWQDWPEIPAVKANNFIHVNADLLHRFSSRMLIGVEDMCRKVDEARNVLNQQKTAVNQ